MHPETPRRSPTPAPGAPGTGRSASVVPAGPVPVEPAGYGEQEPTRPEALLRFLAAALQARAAVVVGTDPAVSGPALLAGMAPDGTSTFIGLDPEVQNAARAAFAREGIAANRVRLITGVGSEVLPRLTERSYDLLLVDAPPREYPHLLELGTALLRTGGVLLFGGLRFGGPEEPAEHDPRVVATRELLRTVRAETSLAPVILPLTENMLAVAVLH